MITRIKAVLIIGGSGFFGTHLAQRLSDGYKVFLTYHTRRIVVPGVTSVPIVLENLNWVRRILYTIRPEIIVYAAGKNNLAWAEEFPREAEAAHLNGAATIMNIAEVLQPKLIYLSNCNVFDGSRGNYRETDTVMPNSALGKAKLGAENFIRGKSLNHVIVRSSPLYGRGNGLHLSLLDRMRMALDRNQRVDLQTSELHSFAPVDGLVDLVERCIASGVRNKVLHYGGLTKLSYYEFGRRFAERFGYDARLVTPKLGSEPQAPPGKKAGTAQSSRKSSEDDVDYSLNSSRAVEMLKIKPLLLEEGFDLIEKQLVPHF